ncbi:HAUS augmin-like complex subunit 6 isoform X2 [Corythoichthys intestinalis]|uniref:HAUS augmin-like complex subunit 6 isoform X2 n=1 Tax=Corythoichthys intestinalis TaxID=161448 RepID=UPI0025A67D19|nr:HAUS augmin-like complex subunit 6 isoform X2 [Corythoichthys intestinalis]
MAHKTKPQKDLGQYLWNCLLGLDFQPGKYSGLRRLNLSPNMFDEPNNEAFYVVMSFLLEKLNPIRYQQTFRYCLSPDGTIAKTEHAVFRKEAAAWLREIMEETGYGGSKIIGSLLLTPGGPKFLNLMVHVAAHVIAQEMKTFTTDDSWVSEVATKPTSSHDMALKRLRMVRKRFLKAEERQKNVQLECQNGSRSIMKAIQDTTSQSREYDELLKQHHAKSVLEESPLDDKAEKVRSLWSVVDVMLSKTDGDINILESALKGEVNQYVLDGTERLLQIPRSLQERMERYPQKLNLGKMYEDGQLNLLCFLELLNQSLRLLKAEHGKSLLSLPPLSWQHLQDKQQELARQQQRLELLRLKISKDEIPEVMSGIRELDAESDKKWLDMMKNMPVGLVLDDDPVHNFLSPMSIPSLEPSGDDCVFSLFPAVLPEKHLACNPTEEESNTLAALKSFCSPAEEKNLQAREDNSTTTHVWVLDMPPSPHETPTVAPQATKVPPTTAKKIMDLECDRLAELFAQAVTTDVGSVGLELEEMAEILYNDPFRTRKQIPRTPENSFSIWAPHLR